MLDQLLTYALTVYLAYHVVSRSELLRRPREWAKAKLPAKLVYPLGCALCWTWWCGLALTAGIWIGTGTLLLSATVLFAAPVFNMVLDLAVRALLKANEPPQFTISTTGCDNSFKGPVSIPTVWSNLGPPSPPSWVQTTWSLGPYPDPQPSHVGRRARVVRGHWSFKGKEGLITRHRICDDDCAGTFRKVVYDIEGVASKVEADDCDLIDTPPAPSTPAS